MQDEKSKTSTPALLAGLAALVAAVAGIPSVAQTVEVAAPADSVFDEAAADAEIVPGLRFVELKSAPLAEAGVPSKQEKNYRDRLRQEKADFRAEAKASGIAFTERKSYEVLFNGLAVAIAPENVASLESLDSVVRTYPVYRYYGGGVPVPAAAPEGTTRENVTVTELTGVPEAHAAGYFGEGVTVGIIDGGIDYNHPALGGPGFPNSKVVGGYDFADDDPDPFDDRLGAASQHGTHVAGIVAGSDGNMVGVAPGAKIRMYRVFGTNNSGGTEDLMLAAMEQAADDGCDVVNMSFGSANWMVYQQGVMAKVVDNLEKRGVVPVVAVGNYGTAGPFLPSSPAIAKKAIAVGAAYNTSIEDLAFRLSNGSDVAYKIMYPGPPTPGSGTYPIVDYGVANCAAIPADVRYDGQVVMIQQGSFLCRAYQQINLVADAGAAAVIWWSTSGSATAFPTQVTGSSSIWLRIPAVVIRRVDVAGIKALGAGATLTWGLFMELSSPLFPGLPAYFSSMGPSHELDFKPDVMAPGGYIFSTIPLHAGSYGLKDGTSMASPHVAGIAALIRSANPKLKAHEIRGYLQSSATPMPFNTAPTLGLEPAVSQGAGLVNAVAAIAGVVKLEPSKIALHDLNGRSYTKTITVENKSKTAITYNVSHVPALTAAPPMTSFWTPMTEAASVSYSSATLTVPGGKSANLTVTFAEPPGVPGGSVLSGWIELAPVGGGTSVRVPYMGLKGDYHELPAINPSFTDVNPTLDNPALRPESRPKCSGPPPTWPACCFDPAPMSCGWSVGKNLPVTLDYTNGDKYDDACTVMVSQGFPTLRKFRARVLNESGRTIAWGTDRYTKSLLEPREYWVRNSGAGTGTDFAEWYGQLDDGSPAPAGTYYIRLEFDKFQGDGNGYPDFESWVSPPITVIRP